MTDRIESGPGEVFYLYGIGADPALGTILFTGGMPPPVIDGGAFGIAASSGLAALFSVLPGREFGEGAFDEKLADPAWTASVAMRHEAVLEHLISRTAIVPLRLGTIFLAVSGVERMLENRKEELRTLLSELEGREEWSVIVRWDRERLRERIDRISPELRVLVDSLVEAAPGRRFLLEKQIESRRGEEVRLAIRRVVGKLRGQLETFSVRSVPYPTSRTGEADPVIEKTAFLVDRKSFERFRETAGAFADSHREDGMSVELVGPLPAYTFVKQGRMTADDVSG